MASHPPSFRYGYAMKVDVGLVAQALDDRSGNMWYLDRTNGDVFAIPQDPGDTQQEAIDLVESEPDRFLVIDPLDSRDEFVVMEDYIDTLPEGEARRSLARAISGPRPFASFKHVLHDFPDERKAWFQFEEGFLLENAREFLRSKEIAFE